MHHVLNLILVATAATALVLPEGSKISAPILKIIDDMAQPAPAPPVPAPATPAICFWSLYCDDACKDSSTFCKSDGTIDSKDKKCRDSCSCFHACG
ncbi:uncharacterized protein E0L32_010170 [Thyridium curvatum]|uniref:Uncharacterized protein n=1 Tax=Thyridium curvatum TaxID=1093900 RepID=A0A507AKT7_9PEZI|nr:uncharacterized protein E0L32_010170 [Thyridium curvatum]TPX08103.1 hypothetical protein E0L32_010170 [Thyridium curvatum]